MGGVKRYDRTDNDTFVADAGLERELALRGDLPALEHGGSVLQEAQEIIHGERNESYGEPADNHSTTAHLFKVWYRRKYGVDVFFDADDVCWFNVFQKISREANCSRRDNLVDIAGYVGNIEMMQERAELLDKEHRKGFEC